MIINVLKCAFALKIVTEMHKKTTGFTGGFVLVFMAY